MPRGVWIWALAIAIASAASIAGCLGDEAKATVELKCPNEPAFTGEIPDGGGKIDGVSAFMERRCGTLDCHGNSLRPMRIYGRLGLRDPQGANITGGSPTTHAELVQNYAAVCGVEPEKMAQAEEDFGQSAEKLLVLEKARGVEGHKGGVVVTPGSAGDDCLLRWLRGDATAQVATACQKAIADLQ